MTPAYAVATERVGAEIRRRLNEPGVLRGRQRSPAFIEQVVGLGVRIAFTHGPKEGWHQFPLARWPLEKLWGVAEWVIKRALPILQRIAFLIPQSETIRRIHDGTQSQTPGAKSVWYCPHLFRLDPAIHALLTPEKKVDAITARFLAEVGADLAASPPPSQCALDETLNVKGLEEEEPKKVLSKLRLQGGLLRIPGKLDAVIGSWERVLGRPGSPKPPPPAPRPAILDRDYTLDPRVLAEKARKANRVRYLPEDPKPAEPYPYAPKDPGYDYSRDPRVIAANIAWANAQNPGSLTPQPLPPPPLHTADYSNDPRVLRDRALGLGSKEPEVDPFEKPMLPKSASPRVLAFYAKWDHIQDIVRDKWPLCFKDQLCDWLPEVTDWLREHVGSPDVAWGMTRVFLPNEQTHNPKAYFLVGFREKNDRFAFNIRFKGVRTG